MRRAEDLTVIITQVVQKRCVFLHDLFASVKLLHNRLLKELDLWLIRVLQLLFQEPLKHLMCGSIAAVAAAAVKAVAVFELVELSAIKILALPRSCYSSCPDTGIRTECSAHACRMMDSLQLGIPLLA
jgi:hypothetical protein